MKVILNIPLLFLTALLLLGCSKDSNDGPIYLATKGVTMKCDASGMVGGTFEVNGITYTIVDETLLREMISQGADLTKVCTSLVDDMSHMFNRSSFNRDISAWDVSNFIY